MTDGSESRSQHADNYFDAYRACHHLLGVFKNDAKEHAEIAMLGAAEKSDGI